MSLPIPNPGNPLASLGASMAISRQGIRSASQLAQRTTLAFGDLLSQLNPLAANGLSEANSPLPSSQSQPSSDALLSHDSSSNYADRIQSIKAKLQNWLDATCKQLGISRDSQSLDIRLDSEQRLEVSGPEPLRTELKTYLIDSEELTAELRSLQESQPSLMSWLPTVTRQDTGPMGTSGEHKRLDPLLIQL